jgi:hypothetical protein
LAEAVHVNAVHHDAGDGFAALGGVLSLPGLHTEHWLGPVTSVVSSSGHPAQSVAPVPVAHGVRVPFAVHLYARRNSPLLHDPQRPSPVGLHVLHCVEPGPRMHEKAAHVLNPPAGAGTRKNPGAHAHVAFPPPSTLRSLPTLQLAHRSKPVSGGASHDAQSLAPGPTEHVNAAHAPVPFTPATTGHVLFVAKNAFTGPAGISHAVPALWCPAHLHAGSSQYSSDVETVNGTVSARRRTGRGAVRREAASAPGGGARRRRRRRGRRGGRRGEKRDGRRQGLIAVAAAVALQSNSLKCLI